MKLIFFRYFSFLKLKSFLRDRLFILFINFNLLNLTVFYVSLNKLIVTWENMLMILTQMHSLVSSLVYLLICYLKNLLIFYLRQKNTFSTSFNAFTNIIKSINLFFKCSFLLSRRWKLKQWTLQSFVIRCTILMSFKIFCF